MKRRMRKGASSVGNVIRIVRSDFKRLFANAMSVIIVIGLVVMPSIFAWYNVIACWNVFDNTGNLTVAVANVDDGYESDLVPLRVNIGERVVSALRANDQIDWTFTTEEDAVDGARSGRYYAAVVIPAGFSKDMLTFYSEDVQHARIVYYANEKKSAIAPKITDQGADSVSYQVNEMFAQTLSEVALGIAESMSAYADEADGESARHGSASRTDGVGAGTVFVAGRRCADARERLGQAGSRSAKRGRWPRRRIVSGLYVGLRPGGGRERVGRRPCGRTRRCCRALRRGVCLRRGAVRRRLDRCPAGRGRAAGPGRSCGRADRAVPQRHRAARGAARLVAFRCPAGARRRHRAHERRRLAHGGHARQPGRRSREAGGWKRRRAGSARGGRTACG